MAELTILQRKEQMKKLQKKIFQNSLTAIVAILISSYVVAEETIIQQEKITFEKCLQVITTSQDKLSVAPEIKDISKQKRIAIFNLVDGTLTINCDGTEGKVTVSTNTN